MRQFPVPLRARLVGEALRWFEYKDGETLARQAFGDGPRDGAADLLIAVEQQHNLAVQQVCFGKHLDSSEGHGNAHFHVQCARTPQTTFGNAARHVPQGAQGPHRVEVAKKHHWLLSAARLPLRGPNRISRTSP